MYSYLLSFDKNREQESRTDPAWEGDDMRKGWRRVNMV
jgi:hypothetical protein